MLDVGRHVGCLMLLVALMGCVWLPGSAVQAMTFQEAWSVLRQEHGSLRAADLERQRLERLQSASRGLLLPQINFEARYTRLNDPIRIDLDPVLGLLPGLPGGLPPLGVTVQDQEYWKANLSAVWPLYTGGRISAGRAAAALELEAAEGQSLRTLNELHSQLVKRYFAVPLAAQLWATLKDAAAGARQHYEHALRLEAEGMISQAERLHAGVALTEADRAARQAERQLAMARTALALFLNRDNLEDRFTPLPEPLGLDDLQAAQLRSAARVQHPVIATLEANRRLAVEGIRAERGRMQPEVFAFGRRELVPSDLTVLEPEWAVGIGVNLALLDRNDRVNRVRAARLRERQVEALLQQVGRDIETLVENLLMEVELAVDQYQALDAMFAMARENLRVRERAFTEGLATSLEVVDARVGLARVETARAAARYQYIVHFALLQEATGSIDRFSRILSGSQQTISQP